jgi:hypothetical protein
MNLYEVQFKGLYPVENCLIIKAKDRREARKIASKTITHTEKFTLKIVDMSKSGVVVYLSGDY